MPEIHIVGDGPEVNIWLDPDHGAPQTGVVIGVGKTMLSAIENAITELERLVTQLRHLEHRAY